MSASLVQPQSLCSCPYAGHGHVHPYERGAASPGYGIGGFALGHPILSPVQTGGFFPVDRSNSSEPHSFSSSPSIVRTNSSGFGNQVQESVEPRVYPWRGGHVKYTHASYRRDSLPELTSSVGSVPMAAFGAPRQNGFADPAKAFTPPTLAKPVNSWTLCLPIPIPFDLPDATLESLVYTIRYASLNAGNASVQTDIVLSRDEQISRGIVTNYNDLPLYARYGDDGSTTGYGPPMLNEALGLSLASVPAFKAAGSGWSHYLDHQRIYPNVQISEDLVANTNREEIKIYLFFHVYEYPGEEALRSISVDVSATWNNGEELKKTREKPDFTSEREQLASLKREVEESIRQLQENVKLASGKSERGVKSEPDAEKVPEKKDEVKQPKEETQGSGAKEEAERRAKEAALVAREEVDRQFWKARFEAERKAHDPKALAEEAERKAKEAAIVAREEVDRQFWKARMEAERKAHDPKALAEEAERKDKEAAIVAREEVDRQFWKARMEAERKAREAADPKEVERRAKEEAERRAKEAALVAREETDRQFWRAKMEAERRAHDPKVLAEEAERKAKEAALAAREEADRQFWKARMEAERKAREEADPEVQARRAKEEAERKAKEAALVAREEVDRQFWKAKMGAGPKAQEEVDPKVQERRAKEEAERRAKEEALLAREEAGRKAWKARAEAERKAREEAEKKAKAEAEHKAQEEAEKRAKAEAERKAREEVERKAKAEAERKAKAEAERKAREEAQRKAREEAQRKYKEEAEKKAKEVAERKAKEAAEKQAKEAAEKKAKEEAAAKAQAADRKGRVPLISEAPKVADELLQEHIAAVASRLGQKCKNGYAWEKRAHGYKCNGGGHFISFKDLGMQ